MAISSFQTWINGDPGSEQNAPFLENSPCPSPPLCPHPRPPLLSTLVGGRTLQSPLEVQRLGRARVIFPIQEPSPWLGSQRRVPLAGRPGAGAGPLLGREAHSSRGSLAGLREGNPRRTEMAPKREEVSLFSVVGVAGHPQSCRGWRRKHWALGLGHKGMHNLRAGTRDPARSQVWRPPGRSPQPRQSLFSGKASSVGPACPLGRVARRPVMCQVSQLGRAPGRPCWCWDSGPLSGAVGAEGSHEDKEPCVGLDSWALTSCSWLTGKSWAGGVTVPRPTTHRPPPGQPRSLWPQQNLTPLLNLQNHLLELTHYLSTGDSQDGMPRTRDRKARAHILL